MAVARRPAKADISLALGSGQIMCSLQSRTLRVDSLGLEAYVGDAPPARAARRSPPCFQEAVMGSDELRVERADRVVTITLDRPADQNRLTRDVLLGLQQVLDRLGGDDRSEEHTSELQSRQ